MSEEASNVKKEHDNSQEPLIPVKEEKPKIFGFEIQKDRKLFVCPYTQCGRIFHEMRNMQTHAKTHVTNRPFICTFKNCRKDFATLEELNSHKCCHPKNEFTCSFESCRKSFSKKHRLLAHEKTHTGLKPYVCEYPRCGKAFVEQGNLKIHMRIHTNEKPYQCYFQGCNKNFRTIGQLNDHLNTHYRRRPYRCEICEISYVRKSILTKHMKTRHKDLSVSKKEVSVQDEKTFLSIKQNLLSNNNNSNRDGECQTVNSSPPVSSKNNMGLKIDKIFDFSIDKITNISSKKFKLDLNNLNDASFSNFENDNNRLEIFEKDVMKITESLGLSKSLYDMINSLIYRFLNNFNYNKFDVYIQEHINFIKILELVNLNETNIKEIKNTLESVEKKIYPPKIPEFQ